MKLVLCLATLIALTSAVDQICQKMSPCGADCYATCDNPCNCDMTGADGGIPFPMYGGRCQDAGFCESEFLDLQDCIEEGGPSCPRKMVSMDKLLESYTKYDFRIDVRTVEEWNEGHANLSIPTPGLAKNPAKNYLDLIEGKEDAMILVYCKSGGRAFEASQNLLRYGFNNIHSFYHGGFPNLEARINEVSEQDKKNHPHKNVCYITGGSDICPTPLPRSHISSDQDILSLGDNVVLVDVRPLSYKESFEDSPRAPANKKRAIKKFLKTVDEDVHTIVTFCEEGTFAFMGAKAMIKHGWGGPIYFYDNGGYKDLKKLFVEE